MLPKITDDKFSLCEMSESQRSLHSFVSITNAALLYASNVVKRVGVMLSVLPKIFFFFLGALRRWRESGVWKGEQGACVLHFQLRISFSFLQASETHLLYLSSPLAR